MRISDYSFHDSMILGIKEITELQILDFLIDYPIDWDNNIFEHHVLRFNDVIAYSISSIPMEGTPTILEINEQGVNKHNWGSGVNEINTDRNVVEIITNAGTRTISYTTCELIKVL